jgi:hypothetical protein
MTMSASDVTEMKTAEDCNTVMTRSEKIVKDAGDRQYPINYVSVLLRHVVLRLLLTAT